MSENARTVDILLSVIMVEHSVNNEPTTMEQLAHSTIAKLMPHIDIVGFAWDIEGMPTYLSVSSEKEYLYSGFLWIRSQTDCGSIYTNFDSITSISVQEPSIQSKNPPWREIRRHDKNSFFYEYECLILLSTWPKIGETIKKKAFSDKLANKNNTNRHTFIWNDPHTEQRDDEIIRKLLLDNRKFSQ